MDGTSEWKRDWMVAKGVVVEAVRRVAVVFSVDMWVGRGMLVMGVKADMVAQQQWLLDGYTAEPALIRLSKIFYRFVIWDSWLYMPETQVGRAI